jgi:hypothetical protein
VRTGHVDPLLLELDRHLPRPPGVVHDLLYLVLGGKLADPLGTVEDALVAVVDRDPDLMRLVDPAHGRR